ncbi:MAG: SnoaL-like domain-containing protein [Bacteroidota bacterium]
MTTKTMTIQQLANKLVEYCRTGQHDRVYKELCAPEMTAYEMEGFPNAITSGIDNLLEKSAKWAEDVQEVHEMLVSDPVVGGNYFSCSMTIDLTKKSTGTRQREEELCLYKVKNGQIVEERFFYDMPM